MTTVITRPERPTRTLSSTVNRREVLLGAAGVGVTVASITPLAAVAAAIPPVVVLIGEWTGRRAWTVTGIVASTLYVVHAPGGLRESLLVALCALAGMVARLVLGGLEAPVHRAVPPALLLLVVTLDFLLRPPVSVPGQYSVFEQTVLLACLIAVLTQGRTEPDETRRTEAALHLALVATALTAGADSLSALSTADAELIAARQVQSVFGASNYVAALLALAAVACIYKACSGSGWRLPNIIAAVACLVMMVPQASRTSTIVVLLVVTWLLVRYRRFVWLLIAVAFGGVVLFLSPSIAVLDRFQAAEKAGEELNGRVELWDFALRLFRSNPLVGVGSGRVSDALQEAAFVPTYVHDLWLSFAAQFGIIGVVFLALGTLWILAARVGRYARVLAITALVSSTVEPVVETLEMGLIFTAVICAGAVHLSCLTSTAKSEEAR
ncbi:O-antigen ligase family protein [Actinomycetospora sp. C-140]